MSMLRSLRFIWSHPLNRGRRVAALFRWMRWQSGSRLLPAPVVLPFVNEMCLVVSPRMTGATGNFYCGLHELEDMALVLHALRADDLFVDVGANIGAYSMLAGAVGAHCVSIEPIPSTFARLTQNISINGLGQRNRALNLGIGREEGELLFTAGLDTVNHVLAGDESPTEAVKVAVRSLDSVLAGHSPALIKVDVEGFETEVVAGAAQALAGSDLLALIIELNGSGVRFGFNEDRLHRDLLVLGFETYRYRPFDRELEPLDGARSGTGNTLYVRDAVRLVERVRAAPRFRIMAVGRDL